MDKNKRVIVLEATIDTDGHHGKTYYKIENGVKTPIKYKEITHEERVALLLAMRGASEKVENKEATKES